MVKVEESEEICKKKAANGIHVTSDKPGSSCQQCMHDQAFLLKGQEPTPATDLLESKKVTKSCHRSSKHRGAARSKQA